MDSDLYALALGQSVLIGAMLIRAPERGRVHLYLAAILWVLGGLFAVVLLKQHQMPPWVTHLDIPLGAALVPLLWLHAQASVGRDSAPRLATAATVGLPIVLGSIGSILYPDQTRVLMLVAMGSAIALVLVKLTLFVRRFDEQYADAGLVRMAWLRNAHGMIAAIVAAALIQHGVERTALQMLNNALIYAIPLGLILLNLYIALNLMQVQPITVQKLSRSAGEKRRSQLDSKELIDVQRRLQHAMQEQHLYRDANLQLQTLSEKVGIAPYSVTEGIRRGLASNFFDFVNRYRIEEAKRLLDAGDITVTDVMYRAGFNSKSSFYQEFRKRTGRTPGQLGRIKPERRGRT